MLLLSGTSALLKVVTGQAVTVDVHVSYVDSNGTPNTQNTAITTATTTTIAGSPASGVVRNIEEVWLTNKHASSTVDVTLQHTDGTTLVQIGNKVTLAAGESLQIDKYGKVHRLDANLAKRVTNSVPGQFVKSTALTSGTSVTVGSTTNTVRLRLQAAGGGGAGCTSVASAASAGGGGGAGGYCDKVFAVTPNSAIAYVLGAAGTGASGALGGTAADSTVTVGGTTVTAKGGVGAPVATALTTLVAYVGGTGGAVGTNGDVNTPGENGDPGVVLIVATPIGVSGNGANSILGAGGKGIAAVGNGNNATGFGAGGSGSFTGASTVRTGGNGSGAILIVDEFT